MRKHIYFVLFIVLINIFHPVSAQSDDITLIGEVSPLFYAESAFSEPITTSAGETAEVQVNSVITEAKRILIRFYITDLPESWKSKISDDMRLYGSYLPVAEIVMDNGDILTPSSASRYSLLEFNSRLIIGGLLVFNTDSIPQAFYLNFNQIPFDTQPLSEGFTKAVILASASEKAFNTHQNISTINNDIEFTLTATAQTNEVTMLQPSVRMLRDDEELTRFGWISITDTQNEKKYAVTRGNLYGFNLTDDSIYSPAHAYTFSGLGEETPVKISMDHAYIRRTFASIQKNAVHLQDSASIVIYSDEDMNLIVSKIQTFPEEKSLRLYIDSGETVISDIDLRFYGLDGTSSPQVTCGIDKSNDQFACDLYFFEISFPTDKLELGIAGVEYRKDGPWELTWTPVPMEIPASPATYSNPPVIGESYHRQITDSIPDEEVRSVLKAINDKNTILKVKDQWIHESYSLDYKLSEEQNRQLIPVDQAADYYTRYILENWYYISGDGNIYESLQIIRDIDTNNIISAYRQKDSKFLDLIHGLNANIENTVLIDYSCCSDYVEIAESSAVFTGEESCTSDGKEWICQYFVQSLTGIPGSRGSQAITFYLDPQTLLVRQEIIDYDLGNLLLNKMTNTLESVPNLPEDILSLIGSFE